MKKSIKLIASLLLVTQFTKAQNVGIGTVLPLHQLHIASSSGNNLMLENLNVLSAGTNNSIYFTNNVNSANFYKYTGAIKSIGSSATSARMGFFTNANNVPGGLVERLTILDNGFVGLGTINPQHTLDVNGIINCNTGINCDDLNAASGVNANTLSVLSDAAIGGNADVTSNVTVNAGKGIIQNSGSTQLRYRPGGASLSGSNLAAGGTLTTNFLFTTFSSPPVVYVANVTSGTGSFDKVLVTVSTVTTTSCTLSITNVSSAPITFSGTWNIVAIGAL